MVFNILGKLLFFLKRKEVWDVAVIYVALIMKGKRDFASIPAVIQPKVRELLVDLELDELIR